MFRKKVTALTSLLCALVLLSACGSAAKLTEYDFGEDKVPSVNAVLGETRKVSGVSVGTENGVQYKQYTYETSTMVDDLAEYTTHLRDDGWMVIKDYDFSEGTGEAQLAIDSAVSGKILVISINFATNRYIVRTNKLDGELTPS
jgi:major membrane immunogen (membrane-anchored lipoprotein)